MNKDLHDTDNLFRSGLEGHKETPHPWVKESLYAALDKEDAESYRKRFIGWKRTALFLLLLLTGFVLYESGIFNGSQPQLNGKATSKKADMFSNKKQRTARNDSVTANTDSDSNNVYEVETAGKEVKAPISIIDSVDDIILKKRDRNTQKIITGNEKTASTDQNTKHKNAGANKK